MANRCHGCQQSFKTSLNIPQKLWERVYHEDPKRARMGGGLLCATCIGARLDALDEYVVVDGTNTDELAVLRDIVDTSGFCQFTMTYSPSGWYVEVNHYLAVDQPKNVLTKDYHNLDFALNSAVDIYVTKAKVWRPDLETKS